MFETPKETPWMILMPNGLVARENTSDIGTWHDVFDSDKAWHRPPVNMKSPEWILDLGAYVGYTTIDFYKMYPKAKIIALEPDPDNYRILKSHTEEYSNIYTEQRAVWNYCGYGRLRGDAYNAKQIEIGANVSVCTIDNIVERYQIPEIGFLKLDVEGAERDILRQPGIHWPHITKCIQVEVHGEYYVSECVADLNRFGFTCFLHSSHQNAITGENNY